MRIEWTEMNFVLPKIQRLKVLKTIHWIAADYLGLQGKKKSDHRDMLFGVFAAWEGEEEQQRRRREKKKKKKKKGGGEGGEENSKNTNNKRKKNA